MDARAWERMGEAGDDDMSERSPWATAGIASRDVDAAMGCQDIVPNGATGRGFTDTRRLWERAWDVLDVAPPGSYS